MLGGMRVLIIGASGYLGSEIRRQAAGAGHDVTGTRFSAARQGLWRLDIRDAEAVAAMVAGFDAVINAAYDKGSWGATAVGPGHLAACCAQVGARLVHISSDAVFSGDLEVYDESCDPSPVSAGQIRWPSSASCEWRLARWVHGCAAAGDVGAEGRRGKHRGESHACWLVRSHFAWTGTRRPPGAGAVRPDARVRHQAVPRLSARPLDCAGGNDRGVSRSC
jgi:hypothetical protein